MFGVCYSCSRLCSYFRKAVLPEDKELQAVFEPIPLAVCKECGKPIAPTCKDGICSVCRIKIRTKKRQEEAVAKAKERQAEREAKRAAEEAAKALAAEVQAESAATAAETAPAAVVPEVPAAETKMN